MTDDEPIVTEHLIAADGSPIVSPTVGPAEWNALRASGRLRELRAAINAAEAAATWEIVTRWDEAAGRLEPVEVTIRSRGEPRPVPARLLKSIRLGEVFERQRRTAALRVGRIPGMSADEVEQRINAPQDRLWAPKRRRRGRPIGVATYDELSRIALEEYRLGGSDWLKRTALRLGGEEVDNIQRDLAGEPRAKGGVTNYGAVEKRVQRARALGFPMPPSTRERAKR